VLIGDDIPIRKSAHFPLLLLVTIAFFLALSVIFLKRGKKDKKTADHLRDEET
jgi:hypothetical protein